MASRISGFENSIFSEISALARQHGAVNLGQGFPDFDGPDSLKRSAQEAIHSGKNQYAQSQGEPELRRAIAEHSKRFYPSFGWEVPFAKAIGAGGKPLGRHAQLAGGIPVAVTLHAPDFRFNPIELSTAFTPKTKAIIINTPHNPAGTVFTHQELIMIAELCQEYDVLAITDEVYEHIIFSEAQHRRIAAIPGMENRTLTISSAGKTFSFTGWKVGWTIGAAELQTAIRRIHQFTVFATATPFQYASADGLRLGDEYYKELSEDYESRRDYLMDVLTRVGLEPTKPEGAYFIMANIEKYGKNPDEFCEWLIKEIGVAAIPPKTLYLHAKDAAPYVRFTFCKKWETLHAAAERLMKLGG
ncbi:MAG: aminotransferase class I/II-fold pyridoxal phosphate-dependent enzyme [Ignavibacteriae bacterium]|nr:aminotransferase class I/II-fold pyridoxal phosphate-dependent enzyme [Ignavibacteriota bacterium]